MAEIIPPGQGGPLVVLNVLNFGHFNSYAETFARWGLEAGREVVLVAHGPGAASPLAGRKGFEVADIGALCRESCPEVDWGDPDQAKPTLGKHCRSIVRDAVREYSPCAVLLVNADEVFFNCAELTEPDFAFDAPVYGVVTFGRREAHLGLEDDYTRRLKAIVARRGGFAGLLSIDELHVRDSDPDEGFLHYLPDPYKEFHPSRQAADAALEETAAALRAFLDAAPGPVIPVLGKFDRRKGNLWILRAALEHPQVRVVVLGMRVPDPEQDGEIDRCLAELAAQGRAFVRFEHLPQTLFDLVFASGRAPFLPLPYRNHTGSSGLQLMAHEHGLPVLVPDFGLMAERVHGHGLGEVFRVGDEAHFRARFAGMLARGGGPCRADVLRFMELFGPGPIGEALSGMLFGQPSGPGCLGKILGRMRAPAPAQRYADEARCALARGQAHGAEAALRLALEADPDNLGLLLVRSMALARLDRVPEAVDGLRRCLMAGQEEELNARVTMAIVGFLHRVDPELALEHICLMPWHAQSFRETLKHPPLPAEFGPAEALLTALAEKYPDLSIVTDSPLRYWQRLGGLYAQKGAHGVSAACFRRAIALEPEFLEYRLNLSDVLRYAKRFGEALEPLAELERLAPGAFGLAHKRGQVLFEQGRLAEARAQFLLEPEDSPHAGAAREYLSRIGAKQG